MFRTISELKPGEAAVLDRKGLHISRYWNLPAFEWKGTPEDAAAQTRAILGDAVSKQLGSDVPLCVLLSGGLDSSAITALAVDECKKIGTTLSTYSFEYEGNKESFKQSLFQPESDDRFAKYIADYLGTNHTILTASSKNITENLPSAAFQRDFPGQADIDSSLMYFCGEIKRKHTVGLSGECSDELFGGYPWFYRPEMLYSDFFPWIHDPHLRASLFDEKIIKPGEGYSYMSRLYRKSLEDCPVSEGESEVMLTARHATWLSMNYFMTSLLERKDRMSMAHGVEIRVPFADHRLWELVFNIPWEIKYAGKTEKSLLREAMKGLLPDNILHRKKNPYPKTHNPEYTKLVSEMLDSRIKHGGILSQILNNKKLKELKEKSGGTWLGQLMDTPQLIAWLVQFDCWFEEKNVILKI
ncbi:MAG: asparagine synthase-related protein [Eubacteriales bacterium]|nr:asparagine synthase-related protein [Eubacteriales bacterium]